MLEATNFFVSSIKQVKLTFFLKVLFSRILLLYIFLLKRGNNQKISDLATQRINLKLWK